MKKSEAYTCSKCGLIVDTFICLVLHGEREHSKFIYRCVNGRGVVGYASNYICEVCASTFPRLDDWRTHMYMFHPVTSYFFAKKRSVLSLRCAHCIRTFPTFNDIESHILEKHAPIYSVSGGRGRTTAIILKDLLDENSDLTSAEAQNVASIISAEVNEREKQSGAPAESLSIKNDIPRPSNISESPEVNLPDVLDEHTNAPNTNVKNETSQWIMMNRKSVTSPIITHSITVHVETEELIDVIKFEEEDNVEPPKKKIAR